MQVPEAASPAERAWRELEANPDRSNTKTAAAAGVSPATVARVRRLLASGQPVTGPGRPPSRKSAAGRKIEAGQRIYTPRLPRQPGALAERGLCASHPQPDLWSSDKHADRQAAQRVCWRCPVLGLCADWSASLPSRFRQGVVYAGQLPRRERAEHDMPAAG